VLLAVFLRYERSAEHPLLNLKMLSRREVATVLGATSLVQGTAFATSAVMTAVIPLYPSIPGVSDGLGWTALHGATVGLPAGIVLFLVGIFSAVATRRFRHVASGRTYGFKVPWHAAATEVERDGRGYQAGNALTVAAVLHLARIGQGQDAPWEVVGTTDTTLTLDRPRYGATVASPLTINGLISGSDESIRVEVRQPSSDQPIGTRCCLPAGGDRQPWTTQVTFKGATAPALTIIASTGGHVQSVERFAITAARPGN